SFPDKDDVINTYEVKFATSLAAAGLAVVSLFKARSRNNPTANWRELLAEGFPFIKIKAICDNIPGVDGWQEVLDEQGFDVEVIERVLAGETDGADREIGGTAGQGGVSNAVKPGEAPRVAFIGPWNFDNGLGFAARGYLSAFMHSRLQTNFLAVERP